MQFTLRNESDFKYFESKIISLNIVNAIVH